MVKRVFIYGRFLEVQTPSDVTTAGFFGSIGAPIITPPPPALPPQAIEILREPSVHEFVGKIYVLTSDRNYQPVTPLGVRNFSWFTDYQKAAKNKLKFYFEADLGDLWRVPWLRQESDEAGAYMAAAFEHD